MDCFLRKEDDFSLNTKLLDSAPFFFFQSCHGHPQFYHKKLSTLRILQIKKVPFIKVSFQRATILEEIVYLNRNNMQTILAYIHIQTCTFIKVQLFRVIICWDGPIPILIPGFFKGCNFHYIMTPRKLGIKTNLQSICLYLLWGWLWSCGSKKKTIDI